MLLWKFCFFGEPVGELRLVLVSLLNFIESLLLAYACSNCSPHFDAADSCPLSNLSLFFWFNGFISFEEVEIHRL
jgi:hypothetical protein